MPRSSEECKFVSKAKMKDLNYPEHYFQYADTIWRVVFENDCWNSTPDVKFFDLKNEDGRELSLVSSELLIRIPGFDLYQPDVSLVHSSGKQNFYIGSIPEDYQDCDVDVVINCVGLSTKNTKQVEVLQIPFQDNMYVEDMPTEKQIRRWLRTIHCLVENRNVLFHCHAGMNRSALICALYLLEYHFDDFESRDDIVYRLRLSRSPLLQNSFFEKLFQLWIPE